MIKPKKMGKALLAFGLSVLMLGTNLANAKEFVSNTAVYFRLGKGTSYSKLGINYKGDVIKGIIEGPWIKFKFNGTVAYTAKAYYTAKNSNKAPVNYKSPITP